MKRAWRFPEVMNAPFVGAVALLALNDHWLKGSEWIPATVTGKLSDFAGLFFFPLLLVALGRLPLIRGRRLPRLHRLALTIAVVATGAVFAIVKTTSAGADFYRAVLDLLWGTRVRFVADPTDLVALTVLPLTWWYGRRLSEKSPLLGLALVGR